jgi:hypothetical protein
LLYFTQIFILQFAKNTSDFRSHQVAPHLSDSAHDV